MGVVNSSQYRLFTRITFNKLIRGRGKKVICIEYHTEPDTVYTHATSEAEIGSREEISDRKYVSADKTAEKLFILL